MLCRLGPGLGLALTFFLVGLFVLQDFGLTWDEPHTFIAGLESLESLRALLLGFRPVPFAAHELPGYHFVFDVLRGGFSSWVVERWQVTDQAASYHFFHLALSSLSILLLYLLVAEVSASTRLAFFSALTLALLPKFVAHSQNNPKDLPGLFVFLLAALLVLRACLGGGLARSVLAGSAFGLALTTRELSLVVPAIVLAWLVLVDRRLLLRRWKEHLVVAGVGALSFLLLWPWLWQDPLGRLRWVADHVRSFDYVGPILYLGRLYPGSGLPWHYFSVSVLISTPASLLVLALCSLLGLSRRPSAPANRVALLGCLWCVALGFLELRAKSRYDGVRHYLPLLPGLAMLVAAGVEHLWHKRRWLLVPVTAAYLVVLVSLVRIHPYQDAYLNGITRLVLPRNAEDTFETEYWGSAYKEGAEWLNRHAERDAEIYLPWTLIANYYLKTPGTDPSSGDFFDTTRPRYLMLITRKALYDPLIRRVDAEYEPVYRIVRQEGTLLEVFKNTFQPTPPRGERPGER